MSRIISGEIDPSGQELVRADLLQATPISHRMQEIAQQFLSLTGVQEVEQGVFSNCPEPIDDIGARMLKAKDMEIPLIEVTMLPDTPEYKPVSQMFGIEGSPALSILHTDGARHSEKFWGNNVRFERIALTTISSGGIGKLAIGGELGRTLEASLDEGKYHGYDSNSRRGPSFSIGISSENGISDEFIFIPPGAPKMMSFLDKLQDGVDLSRRLEGSIESTAVEIPIDQRQLSD